MGKQQQMVKVTTVLVKV